MSRKIKVSSGVGDPAMTLSAYRPYIRRPQPDGSGGTKLVVLGRYVEVTVFAFPGDDRHRPFTTFGTYLGGEDYHLTLPRHYSPRWLSRLARRFEWAAYLDAKTRDAI